MESSEWIDPMTICLSLGFSSISFPVGRGGVEIYRFLTRSLVRTAQERDTKQIEAHPRRLAGIEPEHASAPMSVDQHHLVRLADALMLERIRDERGPGRQETELVPGPVRENARYLPYASYDRDIAVSGIVQVAVRMQYESAYERVVISADDDDASVDAALRYGLRKCLVEAEVSREYAVDDIAPLLGLVEAAESLQERESTEEDAPRVHHGIVEIREDAYALRLEELLESGYPDVHRVVGIEQYGLYVVLQGVRIACHGRRGRYDAPMISSRARKSKRNSPHTSLCISGIESLRIPMRP